MHVDGNNICLGGDEIRERNANYTAFIRILKSGRSRVISIIHQSEARRFLIISHLRTLLGQFETEYELLGFRMYDETKRLDTSGTTHRVCEQPLEDRG